jgi:predicted amidophosphoribosyltransferase
MWASDAVARNSSSIERGVLRGTRGSLVPAIVLLKFAELEPLAAWFAYRLTGGVGENRKAPEADVIVPVLRHKMRRRERGFNRNDLRSDLSCRTKECFCYENGLVRTSTF